MGSRQSMSRRERVMRTLNFEAPDRLPRDLGGMRSTGISAFAYPKLVAALSLPPRRPRIHDTGQMLALPDVDVLEALDCDVVEVTLDIETNAFDEPGAGQRLDLDGDLQKEDLDRLRDWLANNRFTPERVASIASYCRRAREATDRAILFSGLSAGLGFRGGMPNFTMLCCAEPDYVHALHTILAEHAVAQVERLAPAIALYRAAGR